jgi:cilia- and flagella-associated protein 57
MTEVIKSLRNRIRKNDLYIQQFKNKVYSVVQYIDDHDQLKRAVHRELYPIVHGSQIKNVEIDPDIKKEYANQKKYLESSHHSLQKRLEKEDQIHRQDNLNVMNENTQLIEEINNLRREVREQRDSISKKNNEKMANAAKSKVQQASQGGTNGGTNDGQDSFRQSTAEEQEEFEQQQLEGLKHEADVQRGYIAQIQKDLQKKIEQAQKLAEELAQAINGDQN